MKIRKSPVEGYYSLGISLLTSYDNDKVDSRTIIIHFLKWDLII